MFSSSSDFPINLRFSSFHLFSFYVLSLLFPTYYYLFHFLHLSSLFLIFYSHILSLTHPLIRPKTSSPYIQMAESIARDAAEAFSLLKVLSNEQRSTALRKIYHALAAKKERP